MIFSLKIEKYNTTNFYALSSQVNLLHTQRVRIRSCSGPYFPAFGLNTERYSVSLRIQSKCGRIWIRKTSNKDIFHAV